MISISNNIVAGGCATLLQTLNHQDTYTLGLKMKQETYDSPYASPRLMSNLARIPEWRNLNRQIQKCILENCDYDEESVRAILKDSYQLETLKVQYEPSFPQNLQEITRNLPEITKRNSSSQSRRRRTSVKDQKVDISQKCRIDSHFRKFLEEQSKEYDMPMEEDILQDRDFVKQQYGRLNRHRDRGHQQRVLDPQQRIKEEEHQKQKNTRRGRRSSKRAPVEGDRKLTMHNRKKHMKRSSSKQRSPSPMLESPSSTPPSKMDLMDQEDSSDVFSMSICSSMPDSSTGSSSPSFTSTTARSWEDCKMPTREDCNVNDHDVEQAVEILNQLYSVGRAGIRSSKELQKEFGKFKNWENILKELDCHKDNARNKFGSSLGQGGFNKVFRSKENGQKCYRVAFAPKTDGTKFNIPEANERLKNEYNFNQDLIEKVVIKKDARLNAAVSTIRQGGVPKETDLNAIGKWVRDSGLFFPFGENSWTIETIQGSGLCVVPVTLQDTYYCDFKKFLDSTSYKGQIKQALKKQGITGMKGTQKFYRNSFQRGVNNFQEKSKQFPKEAERALEDVKFFEVGQGDGKQKKQMTQENMRDVVNKLKNQIQEIHASGYIHTDIKPDNIFIRRVGGKIEVVVADLDLYRIDGKNMIAPKGTVAHTDPFCTDEFLNQCNQCVKSGTIEVGIQKKNDYFGLWKTLSHSLRPHEDTQKVMDILFWNTDGAKQAKLEIDQAIDKLLM